MEDYLNQIFSDLQLIENDYYNGDFNQWINDLNDENQLKLVYEDLKTSNAKSVADVKDYASFRRKLTGSANDKDESRLSKLAPDYIAQKEKDKKKAKEFSR